jgi:hypothetical protein
MLAWNFYLGQKIYHKVFFCSRLFFDFLSEYLDFFIMILSDAKHPPPRWQIG